MTVQPKSPAKFFVRVLQAVIQSPRYYKRIILVAADATVLLLALWLALYLRHAKFYVPASAKELLLLISGPVIAISTFGWFGIYRIVTRYFSASSMSVLVGYFWLSVLIWTVFVFMSGQQGIPRTAIVGFGVVGTLAIVWLRQAASLILNLSDIRKPAQVSVKSPKPVLIFGAGQVGIRLLNALQDSRDLKPVGFVDSSASLSGQYVAGLRVFHPDNLGRVAERLGVKVVLLAIPEARRNERRFVVEQLKRYALEVKTVPLIEDIAAGRVSVTNLRAIEVNDLLGRDPVPPIPELMERSIRGKSILVTGAGGSIGAELVRQISQHQPLRIVILDSAEPALYAIDIELRERLALRKDGDACAEVVSVLGSILDKAIVRETLERNQIQTIFHAAAYKHVPIVEDNPIVALRNNAFGTAALAEAAKLAKVERVVLISTDKAVRPTNVMGVSKRIAELIFQAHAADQLGTIFTMVRFGNVLDSSGSVVRRFRQQISAGGPVTVTHSEITRYFMSVGEAAELVIQAGAMAKGGEVFVLDMGEPTKIADLALLMIKLAGLDVRDATNPNGDVEIVYTGLRPGEKLYEELLIGSDTSGTEHPRIMLSQEPFIPSAVLKRELDALRSALIDHDVKEMQAIMLRLVEGYAPYLDTSSSLH